MELVFASGNKNKVREIKNALGDAFILKDLEDIGCHEDIPETADTLEGNALIKAQHVKDNYSYDCFADDTGLEVEALNGKPGVYSARYAGPGCTPADNIEKLLRELGEETNRKARFRTVICLILNGETHYFEGKVDGRITAEPSGTDGFGYDPIFVPDGYDKTFAEFTLEEKNEISHRGRAIKKLAEFLRS